MIENSTIPPIVIFAYNRLFELVSLWQSLVQCEGFEGYEIYFFCDGPKNEKDEKQTSSVVNFIKNIDVSNPIYLTISESNVGLATNVISGVSKVLEKHNAVIVLEDDLIVTPNFLTFITQAINYYKSDDQVFSISGYSPKINFPKEYEGDIYFTPRASSWGWATWQNRWHEIDWGVQNYNVYKYSILSKRKFARGGTDLPGMLKNQMNARIDSWAIRWVFNQYNANKVTVYPTISKVTSIGFGEKATHTKSIRRFTTKLDQSNKQIFEFNKYSGLDKRIMRSFRNIYSFKSRIYDRINSLRLNKN